MRKMWIVAIIITVLAITGFIIKQYIGALASGWSNGTPAYSWNLAVNSYDELIANENNPEYLATILTTRLRASGGMDVKVEFDIVTRENTQITVTVNNIQIPLDATEDTFDPQWRIKNSENRIDNYSIKTKDQYFDITPSQREIIISIVKERVTYIDDDRVIIVENLTSGEQ